LRRWSDDRREGGGVMIGEKEVDDRIEENG